MKRLNSPVAVYCLAWFAVVAAMCPGCRSTGSGTDGAGFQGDTLTCEASLLTIVDCGDYTIAEMTNPWDTTSLLQRYLLVPRDKDIPAPMPDGTVVKVPLLSSLVYSSVHASAIKEVGAIGAVTGVCDAGYYKIPEITDGIASGRVTDAGSSMSPSIEKILEFEPEAILVSPFQNAGHGAIAQTGIPIIECADYMETSPLGRAEWIKLFGLLYGNIHAADSIYADVAKKYNAITADVAGADSRPTVISEMVTDGVWYMPGGRSYMAQLFRDAGADYPWSGDVSTGSLQLDFATVYDRAGEADIWLIKTFGRDLTLDELRSSYPLHARMAAFSKGGVYSCNTSSTSFFEDFPFHPELLLEEYVRIFHPEIWDDDSGLKYFRHVK